MQRVARAVCARTHAPAEALPSEVQGGSNTIVIFTTVSAYLLFLLPVLHLQESLERAADPRDPQQQQLLSEMRTQLKKVRTAARQHRTTHR